MPCSTLFSPTHQVAIIKPVVKREETPSRSEETSSADKLLQEILLGDKTSTAKTKTPKKDKKEIDKILDEYIKMGFDLDNVYNLNEINYYVTDFSLFSPLLLPLLGTIYVFHLL